VQARRVRSPSRIGPSRLSPPTLTRPAEQAVCIAEQSSAVEVTFISPTRFVSASPEGVLTVWRIRNAGPSTLWSETTRLIPITTLRGHEGTVTGLFASPPWSVLVSTSEDGSAIVWDTNRFKFLRKLIVQPGEAIRSAAIDDASVSRAVMTRQIPSFIPSRQ